MGENYADENVANTFVADKKIPRGVRHFQICGGDDKSKIGTHLIRARLVLFDWQLCSVVSPGSHTLLQVVGTPYWMQYILCQQRTASE